MIVQQGTENRLRDVDVDEIDAITVCRTKQCHCTSSYSAVVQFFAEDGPAAGGDHGKSEISWPLLYKVGCGNLCCWTTELQTDLCGLCSDMEIRFGSLSNPTHAPVIVLRILVTEIFHTSVYHSPLCLMMFTVEDKKKTCHGSSELTTLALFSLR